MTKIHNIAVARDAKKEYKNFVTSVEEKMGTFLIDSEILMKHSKGEQQALDYFEKHQMVDADSNFEILNELKKVPFTAIEINQYNPSQYFFYLH